MVKPARKPSGLSKAPRKEHPVAPAAATPSVPSTGGRDTRLSVDVPAELHQAVKVAVAQRGTSMRAATIEALTWWLKQEQK
jgi:hypothetical protein